MPDKPPPASSIGWRSAISTEPRLSTLPRGTDWTPNERVARLFCRLIGGHLRNVCPHPATFIGHRPTEEPDGVGIGEGMRQALRTDATEGAQPAGTVESTTTPFAEERRQQLPLARCLRHPRRAVDQILQGGPPARRAGRGSSAMSSPQRRRRRSRGRGTGPQVWAFCRVS
jgi:hypothetical protein